jgi:hypothetical protein
LLELLKPMNSLTLKEKGFTEFVPLKGISFSSLPTSKRSVLVLADITLDGKPTSDILYIGKSKKPAKRILGGYLAGYGGKASRKINSMLFDNGYIEKVAISWMPSDNPKEAQKALLDAFLKEHGEYPLWNASKKKSVSKSTPKTAKTRPPRKPAKPAKTR